MSQSVFESVSASLRPLGGALDSLRQPADLNQLHSLSGFDGGSPFTRALDGMHGPESAMHGLSLDVGRTLGAANAQAMQADAAREFAGPSMDAQVSFLSGINNSGNVVAQSFWTWNGNQPATYASNSDASKWGADHATTNEVVTVNYFFQSSANWNATEKGVWESCLSLWSAITNIEFNEAGSQGAADLVLKRGHDGSAYQFDSVDDGNNAGEIGGSELWVKDQAVISVDTSVPGFGPINGSFTDFGGYVWGTLVHELGHALGLGHAGPYNGSVNTKTQQFSAFDSLYWSVMSYISPDEQAKYDDDYPVVTDWAGNTATTWMPLDILAVQQLYGAPLSTPLNGGQTFGFNTNITGDLQRFFDFTVNKNPVMTIWSAGTDNTLDLSGFRTASDINLNPGTSTSADGMDHNILIAFGTVIETAIGGKGSDSFTGSDLANTLIGGRGSDTFTGGLGGDTMTGGKGNDTFAYTAVAHSTGAGFDTLKGFDFNGADRFDFSAAVGGIDAAINGGSLSDATFDTDLALAVDALGLAANHVVLFTANGGDYAGDTFLVVDGNGAAGYQAGGADFVMLLDNAKNVGAIDGADFI